MQKIIKFLFIFLLSLLLLFAAYGLLITMFIQAWEESDEERCRRDELICTFNAHAPSVKLFIPDDYFRTSYLEQLAQTLEASWFDDFGYGFIPYVKTYADGKTYFGAYRETWLIYHYHGEESADWADRRQQEPWKPQGELFFPHYQHLTFYEHGVYYDYSLADGSFVSFYFYDEAGQFYQQYDAKRLGEVLHHYDFSDASTFLTESECAISVEAISRVRWKVLYMGTLLEHITEVIAVDDGVYRLTTIHGNRYEIAIKNAQVALLSK